MQVFMKTVGVSMIVLSALCVVNRLLAGTQRVAGAEGVTLSGCLVSLIEKVEVPAREPGVLLKLYVKEGDQVAVGDPLAQIDDRHAQVQKKAAELKLKVASEEAVNDVNVRYATATAKVAEAEYLQRIEANRKVAGAVSQSEIRALLLKHHEAVLSIEQAQMRRRIATLEMGVSKAELEAAEDNIRRRMITSPLDGVVVEILHHAGEWVQAGEPVLHIIRVNRLRVEGFLSASKYEAGEIHGRNVDVGVQLARGRRETFKGKVVFVDPRVQASNEFRVWAEVDNKQRGGHWLLGPGRGATMTIHLK